MAFVKIDDGNDRFYILPWDRLRDILVGLREAYLAKHNGTRPKKWDNAGGISDGEPRDIHPDGKRFLMIKESAAPVDNSLMEIQADQEPGKNQHCRKLVRGVE